MKEKARVTVSGLTEEVAIELVKVIRKAGIKSGLIDIDHPEPDPILEKEYQVVDMAVSKLDDYLDDVGGWDDGVCKLSEAGVDLKSMQKMVKKLEDLVVGVHGAVSTFENAFLEKQREEKSS